MYVYLWTGGYIFIWLHVYCLSKKLAQLKNYFVNKWILRSFDFLILWEKGDKRFRNTCILYVSLGRCWFQLYGGQSLMAIFLKIKPRVTCVRTAWVVIVCREILICTNCYKRRHTKTQYWFLLSVKYERRRIIHLWNMPILKDH